ncbi:flap endonuclease GEN-like 1 [Typha latifolia]|uniref:flap endonuclease GEN-like 1 n=1 Tax=Typha latifolia TaxID=4733 RepID=UPI003C2D497E
MGVGGNFWDLLKPCARHEGVDFLRDKRVAVDLSFWIVQHDAAIRARSPRARSPHLRTTFFRTLTLFSKMGAFPVFVVDGEPSPLKSQARIKRFFLWSGLDPKIGKDGEETTPVKQRNRAFTRCVEECVELLELLGMPVLKARCEAEALCAQLNKEGHVDACLTADSDSFLFGAKCVIKSFKSNSKEPFEVYNVSDIEACLGLKRKQMVAIALLVGNDHDLHGVPGFGVDTALRFVQLFSADDILNRLNEVGKGTFPFLEESIKSDFDVLLPFSDEGSTNARSPHCSHCGHPGGKRAHSKISCEYCLLDGSKYCIKKPTGFKCLCPTCDKDRKIKKQKRHESWQIKACKRIAAEQNFPNNEIIELYLCDNHGNYKENDGPSLRWDKPKVEALVDFLTYHQHWEPSYIRQRMLPMLSTIYLREMASTSTECFLLNDQYEFHSIERVKIRYGHAYYLVKWKRASCSTILHDLSKGEAECEEGEHTELCESTDMLDEPEVPQILVDDGSWFLLTDENMELVQAAYPKEAGRFQKENRLKELKSTERKSNSSPGKEKLELSKSNGVQLSITEFYRSAKVVAQAKLGEEPQKNPPREEQQIRKERKRVSSDADKNLSKSVRRRLLFD